MNIPEYIELANLPTKIEKLESLSKKFNKNIYIKRDDHTGIEISGNKVRKLEFAAKEALDMGADYLITCGGIQSNHARATTAVARKLGLKSVIVLRGNEDSKLEGNYFYNKILGADIRLVSSEEYSNNRMEIMENIKREKEENGEKAYILPEGASNGIGSFGYYKAMEEILEQEKDMGIKFDAIVSTVGSGGTYAGLYYFNHIKENPSRIYGINICDDADHFKNISLKLFDEIAQYTKKPINVDKKDIDILDGYAGLGYAKSKQEEIDFIRDFARDEAIILDPVYTGKAMYGFVEEIKKGSFDEHDNILFIHTGGIFGWNERARSMVR